MTVFTKTKMKIINIRDARPLLSKLSEEVVRQDNYYVITVRNKPKSILSKYNEKLIQALNKEDNGIKNGKRKSAGKVFADGMSKWLKNNPPIYSKEDITSQIDKIAYA